MTFEEKLQQKQNLVEERLREIFEIHDAPVTIIEAMKYSLLAGGKRIRPVLAETICTALGGKHGEALNLGCAIEMIHTYSLIHDDLPAMDNDDLRRGKPTNHVVFGEAKAILAGDGLLNHAFEVIFSECVNRGFDCRFIKAGEVIAKSAGVKGMIGGQVIDMEYEGKNIDLDKLYEMHEKKTGALITASCLTGWIISGNTDYYDIVEQYSKKLGIAFQIVDDILDCTGDVKKLGKKIGSDMDNNKTTFVSTLGLEKSKELAMKYSNEAMSLAHEIDKEGFLAQLTDYLLYREN